MTEEEVLKEFEAGYDCGQVVMRRMAEKLGLDVGTACRVSTGFGAGMMRGETCGAVIAAYMALGLKYGPDNMEEENQEKKVASIIKNNTFNEKFKEKYDSFMCRELMGADFSTKEGLAYIQEHNLMTTFCPKLVAEVISILEELI